MTTLQTRLPMLIVVLVTCSTFISGMLTYSYSSELLLRKSKDELEANAFRTGEAIHGLIMAEMKMSEILASQDVFRDALAANETFGDKPFSLDNQQLAGATQALRKAFAGSADHEKFWLGNQHGVVIASSEEQPETGDIVVSDRPYFVKAMQGETAVSGTVASRANGREIVVAAAPIKDDSGQTIGVIGNSIYLSFFSDRLRGIKVNERGKLYIVDANGIILAHSTDEQRIGTAVSEPSVLELVKEPAAGGIVNGTLEVTGNGENKYLAYSKIPFADWVVIMEDDVDDIYSPLYDLGFKFLLVLVVVVIAAFLIFALLLSQWVTKPLQSIMDVMTEAGAGRLGVRVPVRSNDEFGVLGRALNQMLLRIRELIEAQEKATQLQVEYVSEKERSQLSDMLRKSMHKLNSTLDEDDVHRFALEELAEFVPYDRASVWVQDDDKLVMKAVKENVNRLPAMDAKRIHDYFRQISQEERPLMFRTDTGCFVLAIPVHLHSRLTGMKVIERMDCEFERGDAELAYSFSGHMIFALSNAMLYRQMKEMAVTDELTNMHNRRYFYELAEREFEQARERRKPLSVILFDIDYFKQVNDRYGHLAGDEVLRRIAEITADTLPKGHVLARFGGEEFVLLLPGMDGSSARQVADEMRQKVSRYAFQTEHGPIHVSISMGVAEKEEGDHLDALLKRADGALYSAKEQGRNRVVLH